MNILILAKHKSLGGLIKHIGLLGKGLEQFTNDNVIVGISPGEGETELRKTLHVKTIPFSAFNPYKIWKSYKTLSSIVKSQKIRVIHAQNRIPAIYAAVYCCFHKNVKYLWSNHQVPIPSDWLHRMMTHYGELAVAEGIEGQRLLINELKIPKEKTRIVNLGIELDQFNKIDEESQKTLRESLGIKLEEKVLLLYGRLAASKGHFFLLDALHRVENTHYKLILPGEDNEFKNQVIERAKEYRLNDNLLFPGFVNGRDYLSISDLVLLPSKNEGFPQACIEAFSMGVPVIRTKTGGFEDTQDMCWGVEYGDIDEFARLLNAFFDNEQSYLERASYAQVAVNRLSIEKMSEDYHSIYKEIIGL